MNSILGGVDMNYCDRSVLLPYLQDMCALITAQRVIQGKLGRISLMTFCGRVLMILASACFAWCIWYAIDFVRDFNVYLEWAYGSSSWDYWVKRSHEVLPDAFGVAVFLVFSVVAFICGISMSRRKRTRKELDYELNWLSQLLARAYEVNLIPLQYRTPRCIFYLYNWFNAGTSDDLSIALNTFMHEDGERLDNLVARQGKVILKQRIALARQMQPDTCGYIPVDEIRTQLNAYLTGPNNL